MIDFGDQKRIFEVERRIEWKEALKVGALLT